MRIIGVMGAIVGFILALLLLSFIICSVLINGEFIDERKRKNNK